MTLYASEMQVNQCWQVSVIATKLIATRGNLHATDN